MNATTASVSSAEELIVSGKVRVNGKVVKELGSEADPFSDRIEALGETVKPEKKRWFLFYKPDGVITSVADPEGYCRVLRHWS